ncbi:hypothetical protein GCM10010174_33120 [Kutzneria viridogrisea]|uniref:Uncharacterized protein YukE n=1 Tax=Kutzneria viridogrisea TaxID=47990 RepID=A0ABR6BR62_9PSEU|nr:uncharacterized protein YukE [Kutzneria viridogrisea]
MADLPELTEQLNWLAVPHEQLWREINTGPGPGAVLPAEDFYRRAGQAVAEAQQCLQDGLTRLTAGWQGAAASEAAAAVQRLHDWAGAVQQGMAAAGSAAAQQAQHYSDARSKIPAPNGAAAQPTTTGPGVAVANNADHDAVEKGQADAHRKAAEAMATYQAQSAETVGALPDYGPAPDFAVLVGTSTVVAGGSASSGHAMGAGPLGGPAEDRTRSSAASPLIPGQQVPAAHTSTDLSHAASMAAHAGGAPQPHVPAQGPGLGAGPQVGVAAGAIGGGLIGGVLGSAARARGEDNSTRKQAGGATSTANVREVQQAVGSRHSDGGGGIMQPASGRHRAEDAEHDNKYGMAGDELFHHDELVAPTVIGEGGEDE